MSSLLEQMKSKLQTSAPKAAKKEPALKFNSEVVRKVGDEWKRTPVGFTEDRDYIYITSDIIANPNISSHTLVNLVGLNKFSSIGKQLLSSFGFLERSPIPPYQQHKGGIIEYFTDQYLAEVYGDTLKLESFELDQFENYNQFPDEAPFTGALDKYIHIPVKLPIEVKSKEMKDYNWIVEQGNWPIEQLTQGANQAVLAGADKYMMVYGFIKPGTSKYLQAIFKEDMWIFGNDYARAVEALGLKYDMFEFAHKIFDADRRKIIKYREQALTSVLEVHTHKRIPKKYFKANELSAIKSKIKESQSATKS